MKPKRSYTIWFSQRTGSSLLCKALEATGVAGRPGEWLLPQHLLGRYGAGSPGEFRAALWESGSTPNGVCGVKYSFAEPNFSQALEAFRRFPDTGERQQGSERAALWARAFPNGRHIFMTRRNKVYLAVSWWKAIQSHEWHREAGAKTRTPEVDPAYSFDAIHHLLDESIMRECGIQQFFAEAGIVPMTIVYEDFITDYEGTVRQVLKYLDVDSHDILIAPPYFERTADEASRKWADRFREELQEGWINRGW